MGSVVFVVCLRFYNFGYSKRHVLFHTLFDVEDAMLSEMVRQVARLTLRDFTSHTTIHHLRLLP